MDSRVWWLPPTEEGYSVEQTVDGGYIIAGYHQPFGGTSNIYVIKNIF